MFTILCSAAALTLGSTWLGYDPRPPTRPAPTHQGISIHLDRIHVSDEDDPLSNDEPYLIATRFQFRAAIGSDGRSLTMVPGTLQVANVMSGHGSLRAGENWADEGRGYDFTPRYAQNLFRRGEEGWVIGAVFTLFEKDGFSASTARLLSDRVKEAIERSIRETRFSAADSRAITDALIRKVTRDLKRSLNNLDVGGIIRGIASGVDPDDYGGSQVVLCVIGPRNRVLSYIGLPSADLGDALADVVEVTRQREISLSYPTGDLSRVPDNARFKGRYRLTGLIKVWDQEPLY